MALLEGLVGGLVLAWLLAIFGVDAMFIEVMQPLASIPLTQSHFYVVLAVLGMTGGLLVSR